MRPDQQQSEVVENLRRRDSSVYFFLCELSHPVKICERQERNPVKEEKVVPVFSLPTARMRLCRGRGESTTRDRRKSGYSDAALAALWV